MQITSDVSTYIDKLVTYHAIFCILQNQKLRTKDMIISCLRFCMALEPIKHSMHIDILRDLERLEKTMDSLYGINEFPEYYI